MLQPTYGDIRDKLVREHDLADETFVDEDEMLGYYNDAVDEAEAEIHGIYEDYFLSRAFIALELGTELYKLPSDIYANKIRRIVYNNGSLTYEIKRLRDWKKFIQKADMDVFGQNTQYYSYFLQNTSAAAGVELLLTPASLETSEENLTCWYIRNANRATTDSDVCDIPEFTTFIYAHMRCSIRRKEFNGEIPSIDIQALEQQRKLMIDTLTAMVPDDQTEVETDMSHYWDHV